MIQDLIQELVPQLDELRQRALDERLPIADRVHAEIERMRLIDQVYTRELARSA